MSDLQLQNLSNSLTTNCLTTEETSLIMGGFSFDKIDFVESILGDLGIDDIDLEKISSFRSSGLKKSHRKRLNSSKKSNAKANNLIVGTPGDDVIIAD